MLGSYQDIASAMPQSRRKQRRLTVCLKAYPDTNRDFFQQPLQALVELLLGQKHFIYIAPSPVFSRLKGLHYRMLGLMEVFGGVFVLRRIAAADVTADQALSQVDPGIAHLEALLTAFAAWLNLANFFYVLTSCLLVWHASLQENRSPHGRGRPRHTATGPVLREIFLLPTRPCSRCRRP